MPQSEKLLSGTALGKEIGLQTKELFSLLLENGLIEKNGETWELTPLGIEKGGQVKNSKQFGPYIVWPESIKAELTGEVTNEATPINTTALSKIFNVSRQRINLILSELGFVTKDRKGWILTGLGKSLGGAQLEHQKTGIPYVHWPESILENRSLTKTMGEISGNDAEKIPPESYNDKEVGFREKYEAKHRTTDGHMVRSKSEMIIDNWLYMSEIVHAYERKLPVEEELYCDFYLPVGKIYIEYWGYEDNEKYQARKKVKQDIYHKYEFNLIELDESDIQNLDDILPKKLLKFGIQVY